MLDACGCWARLQTEGPDLTDSIPRAFTIENETAGEGVTVRAAGELDIATADDLLDAIRGAALSDAPLVVLDLSGVTFMDSAGVRCVLQAVAVTDGEPSKVRVRRAFGEQVERLFELVGAIDRLPYV